MSLIFKIQNETTSPPPPMDFSKGDGVHPWIFQKGTVFLYDNTLVYDDDN